MIGAVHVVICDFEIRDFAIIGQCLDVERQQLMFTMLFTALFMEENCQMETKQSDRCTELQDASNKRKEVGKLEIFGAKTQCSTF